MLGEFIAKGTLLFHSVSIASAPNFWIGSSPRRLFAHGNTPGLYINVNCNPTLIIKTTDGQVNFSIARLRALKTESSKACLHLPRLNLSFGVQKREVNRVVR